MSRQARPLHKAIDRANSQANSARERIIPEDLSNKTSTNPVSPCRALARISSRSPCLEVSRLLN